MTGMNLREAVERANDYLEIDNPTPAVRTPWGCVVEKGNISLSQGAFGVSIRGHGLDLRDGKTLHERVLIIRGEIPIRSHEEEDQEVVTNIGDVTIYQVNPPNPESNPTKIMSGQTTFSFNMNPRLGDPHGFYHGFKISPGDTGLLYVAKALLPNSLTADGRSFDVPKNTYVPEAFGPEDPRWQTGPDRQQP